MRKFFNLILVSFILTSCQAQQTELKLNLEKGKEYKQIIDSKATIIQDFNGQKMNTEMTTKRSMSYLVKVVNENDYEMEVKYDSLSMSMQLPQGTMEYSSEKNDEQDIYSMIFAGMKNNPFQITMTKSGKITEIKNIELFFTSTFSKFSQIPESQMEQIKALLIKAYGEKSFKGDIESVTAIYPDKSAVKGESWEIKTKLETAMSADMTTTYKYAESNSNYNLIVGDSKITTADKDAYLEINGMPLKFDLTGNRSSEIKVDKTSGWIIEAKINQDIQGDAYIKGNPQMPDGMKIPVVMKNDMTLTNQ
ncbi:MAG: DUF6263 family protein [Bacteroidota bacterium]